MAREEDVVRSRRTLSSASVFMTGPRARRPVIAVTGAATPLGAAIARALRECVDPAWDRPDWQIIQAAKRAALASAQPQTAVLTVPVGEDEQAPLPGKRGKGKRDGKRGGKGKRDGKAKREATKRDAGKQVSGRQAADEQDRVEPVVLQDSGTQAVDTQAIGAQAIGADRKGHDDSSADVPDSSAPGLPDGAAADPLEAATADLRSTDWLAALAGSRLRPKKVLAVDSVQGDLDGVTWRVVEMAGPQVAEGLAGADVVVHVAAPTDLETALTQDGAARRARAVRTAQAVVTAAAAVGARHLVAVTSAMVFGARADNPIPLPDESPIAAPLDAGLVGDLLDVERVLQRASTSHPSLQVAVLRPAALVGPGIDTVVTRHFEAPRLLAVRGTSTRWQFCHVNDVATAVVAAIEHGLTGGLTCGSEPLLDQDELERLSGMRRVELPPGLAFGTAERLHRVGVLPMPAGDLAYVVHPWVVGSQRLREVGWSAAYSTQACLAALLESVHGRRTVAGRRMDRRDAALGAAGAAVALVGTAAAVRQARARRNRRSRPTL